MNKEEILMLLNELDKKLIEKEIVCELFICGGAVMALNYDEYRRTDDIDGIFRPNERVRELIIEIAKEHNISQGWLNDSVKSILDETHFSSEDRLRGFINLSIYPADSSYMSALKCLTALKIWT